MATQARHASGIPSITVISGPENPDSVDTHELFFARRSLALLKERLGSDGLKALLKPDIDKANSFYASLPSTSYVPISITLQAHGISAGEFLAWFKSHTSDLSVMLAAHPEHYINGLEVLETVGHHLSLFDLEFYPDGPPDVVTSVPGFVEDRYPVKLAAAGVLQADRAVMVGYACHQFRDLQEAELSEGERKGLEAKIGGCLPEGVGKETLELQTRHLLVEWRNWMREAIMEQKTKDGK